MVRSVSWATNAPLSFGLQRTVYLEGQPRDEGARVFVSVNNIEDGYFETIGTAFRSGRDFTTADRDDSVPVAIINEAMVEQFFPETDPIGKRFQFYGDDFYREIVGVVATAKYFTLGEDPRAVIFSPRRQTYADAMALHIRTNGDAADALAGAQRILREADSTVPVQFAWTIAELIDQSLWAPKMAGVLLGEAGILALVLASIGLYGVMAFMVSQRNREIGLRMALGAARGDVVSMVLKHAMILVGIGTFLGLAAVFAVSNLVESILFGSARDPVTFVGVAVMLAVVAFLATLVPALKASRVDPLVAPRYE